MASTPDWEREIRDLHAFFSLWYSGDPDVSLDRLDAVLATGFALDAPDGDRFDRAATLEVVGRGRGSGRVAIWIESPELIARDGPVAVCRYEEWQDRGDGPRGRRSTAVMLDDAGAPNGCRWLWVGEHWIT